MKTGVRAEHAKLGCATMCTDRCQLQDWWKRNDLPWQEKHRKTASQAEVSIFGWGASW